jgi:hypothetical protein
MDKDKVRSVAAGLAGSAQAARAAKITQRPVCDITKVPVIYDK